MKKEQDREQARKIRKGDEECFEALYRQFYEPLLRFITSYVGSASEAEEIYQDLFADLWQRRRSWREGGSIKAYLYKVARNRAVDFLRHREVERAWASEELQRDRAANGGPDADLYHLQLTAVLEALVRQMPERRRLIFVLSREHQLTYREIAEVLDLSVKTVETQMGRALRSLREGLSPYLTRVA